MDHSHNPGQDAQDRDSGGRAAGSGSTRESSIPPPSARAAGQEGARTIRRPVLAEPGPSNLATWVPGSTEPAPLWDPTVGLYLGPYGGPKGGGGVRMSEVPLYFTGVWSSDRVQRPGKCAEVSGCVVLGGSTALKVCRARVDIARAQETGATSRLPAPPQTGSRPTSDPQLSGGMAGNRGWG